MVRAPALAAVAVTVTATVAIVPLALIYEQGRAGYDLSEWFVGGFAPGFAISGWWLTQRRPRLIVGWLFLAGAVTVAMAALAAAWAAAAHVRGWPGVALGRWVFSWLWLPHTALLSLALLLFPDGVVRGRLHRVLLWLVGGTTVVGMMCSFVRPGVILTTPDQAAAERLPVVNPVGIDALGSVLDLLSVPLLVADLTGFVPVVWTWWWWRRSEGIRRRQYKWATFIQLSGASVLVLLVMAPSWAGPVAILQTLAAQLLLVVAILQWRAYQVDVVVRRSVLAVSLLAAALGSYGAVVVVISLALGRSGPIPGAIGALVAIFTFGPLSTIIRDGVNRAFYGRRDDPYTVVAELGRSLARAADPAEGLAAVVGAVSEQLRLPYAEVRDAGGTVLAAHGAPEPDDQPVALPLEHQGEAVGELRVGHRRGSARMTDAESDLLSSLSHQVGAAVVALTMLRGLRAAREREVLARQDERRRIQHDLHDELTPQLTAVTLKLDAARNHLAGGANDQADGLVASSRSALGSALDDVRRLVYALGDPTIASLGLGPAVADRVLSLTHPAGIVATVDIDDLPALPAATEEAVFRIVTEAVTNVVRHAGATRCSVRLALEDGTGDLVVEVGDDGRGMTSDTVSGVGTVSMRDRAGQLGGSLELDGQQGSGTRMVARIPVDTDPLGATE